MHVEGMKMGNVEEREETGDCVLLGRANANSVDVVY